MKTTAEFFDEGYNAAWDGLRATQNPYKWDTDGYWNWNRGWESGTGEMQTEMDCADDDEFDSGRWTQEDEDSMSRGRDLPLRNEAGEYMF